MTTEQTLQFALKQQQGGRFAAAEQAYRSVLAQHPNHPDAWHLFGTLALACGKPERALDYISRAIALRPAGEYYLNLGNILLGAKRESEAVAALRNAIQLRPDMAEAHYVLGLALRTANQLDESAKVLAQAVALKPQWADARNALGVVQRLQGNLEAAAASYMQAIRIQPNLVAAIVNLGLARKLQGKLPEAVAAYQKAVALEPESADHLINLGITLFDSGNVEQAIASYQRALQIRPDDAGAHNNLGISLAHQGSFEKAMRAFARSIQLDPNVAEVHSNLGNALRELGKHEQSILAHLRAIELDSKSASAYGNLGISYKDQGALALALQSFQQALQLNPNDADTYNNLGLVLKDQGRIDDAIAAYHKALALKPNFAQAFNNLGAMKEQGRLDEAVNAIRRAIELDPKAAEVHSNLVLEINFHPAYDQARIFQEARAWGQQRADPLLRLSRVFVNDPDPDRRLKIGYVSADLTYHPVGRFVAPMIERRDRRGFEIHCFSNVARADSATEWFRKTADRWHEIRSLTDNAAAELIAAEEIDILVDLSLHTGGNRLLAFARKPAPVQVTHLAYCGTSGMEAMDYVIADPYLLPEKLEPCFVEKPARLANCYWCYRALPDSPEVGPLPALANAYVTFGCLNNFGKVSHAAFETWCDLLKAVPGSRLLVHSKEGSHRDAARDRLKNAGVDPGRLDFSAFVPLSKYLEQYRKIDIGLDPFPFAGGTTTCDALWMGVPVVTLVGQTTVSRGGLSILTNTGLPELVTRTREDYLKVASELAFDLPRLANLRATLRQRLQASPLMNESRYVADVESAYRQMWRTWCGSQTK